MKTKIRELLPIGSVVQLEGREGKVMISGIMQDDESGETCDYSSVIYPAGRLGNAAPILFNHESITGVLFRGCEDADRGIFIDRLSLLFGQA